MAKYFISYDQTHLSLFRFSSHATTESAELGEGVYVFDERGSCVAMYDHGLVVNEHAVPLIVAPNSSRLRVRRRASEDSAEHLQRLADPEVLVDGRRAISLHARDE